MTKKELIDEARERLAQMAARQMVKNMLVQMVDELPMDQIEACWDASFEWNARAVIDALKQIETQLEVWERELGKTGGKVTATQLPGRQR